MKYTTKSPYIRISLVDLEKKGVIITGKEEDDSKKEALVEETFKGCESCKKGDKLVLSPSGMMNYHGEKGNQVQFIDENDIIATY